MRAIRDGRSRACDLTLALDFALDLALDVARALDRDLARDLVRDLSRDRDAARDRALIRLLDPAPAPDPVPAMDRNRALVRIRDVTRALTGLRDLARDLAFALDHDHDLEPGRIHELGHALDRLRNLTGALAPVLDPVRAVDPTRALNLAGDLDRALIRARDLAYRLENRDAVLAHRIPGRRTAVRVAPVAGRLVTLAARMLPVQDRARYVEEFRSELWWITQVGGGRLAQLAYATRQVTAAPRLRAGLRAPRRRGAVQ